MNAPTDHMTLAPVELLPLTACAPSETHVQAKRRARYSAESIVELAGTLRTQGQLEAILVRPLVALRNLAKYEIVFGERRWLAAEKAELAHIRAEIREMTNEQVIAAQLVENLQREGLDPLDEAEGYRELMQVAKVRADQIGGMIGRSRSYVYSRLKLLDITPQVAEALRAGEIDQSVALLLARIPVAKLQVKALKAAIEKNAQGKAPTYREISERLREKFMVRLDGVPFPIEHEHLHETRGACLNYPHYSFNDPELQAQVAEAYGEEARLCTDRPCHDEKVKTWFMVARQNAIDSGRQVIEGDDARQIKPDRFEHEGLRGYIDLDQQCDLPVSVGLLQDIGHSMSQGNPIWRELLRDKAGEAAVFIDPFSNRPRDVLPIGVVAKALKGKVDLDIDDSPAQLEPRSDMPPERTGRAPDVDHEARRREDERQRGRQELELAVRRRVLDLVHKRWKGPLKRDDLEAIANRWLDEQDAVGLSFMDWYYGGRVDTAKMNERELGRFVLELAIWSTVEHVGDSPGHLIAIAKRLNVDMTKVRRQVKSEIGEPEETPFDEKPKRRAKKKAGGKKARKK